MCEIFGFTGNKPYNISKLLKEFFSHSINHPHGWGAAIYGEDNAPVIIREPVPAYESRFIPALTGSPTVTRLALAHIRHSTRGSVSVANTHPFLKMVKGVDWILVHNGTVNYPFWLQNTTGNTDSENILMQLTNRIGNAGDKPGLVITALEDEISKISAYGKMNLLFTDGDKLYAYSNREETLYFLELDGCTIFATRPVKTKSTIGEWKALPINRLYIYKDGKSIYRSSTLGGTNSRLSFRREDKGLKLGELQDYNYAGQGFVW